MANNPFSVAAVGQYIPARRIDNLAERVARLDYDPAALRSKIGILATARKEPEQETSDLCVLAFDDLAQKLGERLRKDEIDLIVVVTQHPDGAGLPHSSAILHGKLGMARRCFAFDISLGCSGYVAALAAVSGYLMATGGKRALLFTCDPYSKSLSEDDRNTAMIFGDAATVSLIEPGTTWQIGAFDCGTDGAAHHALERDAGGVLRMEGRAVFNFCALTVPGSVKAALEKNGLTKEDIDRFVLHPGSKYIVDTVAKRLELPIPAVLDCEAYGNTVSSSLPLILSGLNPESAKTVLLSGFGVGLGWATCVLKSE